VSEELSCAAKQGDLAAVKECLKSKADVLTKAVRSLSKNTLYYEGAIEVETNTGLLCVRKCRLILLKRLSIIH